MKRGRGFLTEKIIYIYVHFHFAVLGIADCVFAVVETAFIIAQ